MLQPHFCILELQCCEEFNWVIFKSIGSSCSQRGSQPCSGLQIALGCQWFAGHGRWSCDVVAMVKGGLGCGMAAQGGLVTYGS